MISKYYDDFLKTNYDNTNYLNVVLFKTLLCMLYNFHYLNENVHSFWISHIIKGCIEN